MKTKTPPRRYHAALVTLHWLIALLLLSQAVIGLAFHFHVSWASRPAELQIHMILGIATLAAVVIRIAVRFVTPKPASATTGNPFLDLVGKATHAMLYILLVVLTGSGLLSALHANMLGAVVGRLAPRHGHFDERLHFLFFLALGALVTLHVAAALYHQLIRRDRLFARMGYGRATEQEAGETRA